MKTLENAIVALSPYNRLLNLKIPQVILLVILLHEESGKATEMACSPDYNCWRSQTSMNHSASIYSVLGVSSWMSLEQLREGYELLQTIQALQTCHENDFSVDSFGKAGELF
jgi:hypothetical protein